jgi:hypothetical protein
LTQFQSTGAVNDAFVLWYERQIHHGRTGSDNRLFELHYFLSAIGSGDFNMVRAQELTHTLNHIDFTRFRHARQTTGHLLDYAIFVRA